MKVFLKNYGHDLVFAGGLLLLAALLVFLSVVFRKNGDYAEVAMDGKVLYNLPLSADTAVELSVDNGSMLIEVKNGKVAVTHSPCLDQVCVHSGWIEDEGAAAICLPNRVVVTVRGKEAP